jgi:hypothetical protein
MIIDWMSAELVAIVVLVVGHFAAIVKNRANRSH